MPDSPRKDIIEALAARLAAITVASGYRRTITTVAYEAKDWAEVPDSLRDWVGIVPQAETFTDFPGHVQSLWAVDLIFHLTPSAWTAAAVLQAIVDMTTDVRRKLCTSPSNLEVDGVHYIRLASRRGTEADPAAVEQGVASMVLGTEIVFEEGLTDS